MEWTGTTDLVERHQEVRRLDELCERARSGSGRTVTIVGEPGIGKSALLRATAELAERSGMRVLSARAAEIEQDYAFGLVRQLVEPLLLDLAERRDELLSGPAASAAHVFSPPSTDPDELTRDETGRDLAILHGLHALLAGLAREQPLLLCLDDLQWADAASVRFLLFLSRRIESSPVLVVGTLRSNGQAGPLGELVDDSATAVVAPHVLGAEGVGELVERHLRRRPTTAETDALLHTSGGNPFYVLSLLRETGTPPGRRETGEDNAQWGRQADGGWMPVQAGADAPERVVRSVERRLDALSASARKLARALTVLGEKTPPAIARKLAGLGVGSASDARAELVSAGLLRAEGDAIFFWHPIVGDAVYATISPSRRARLHARAATLLGEQDASLDQVAAQLVRSPAPNPRAAVVLREAAQDALRRGAPEAACAYLARLLGEPLVAADRAAVLLELGVAQARAGLPAAVDSLRACAEEAADPGIRAEATIALAHMLNAVGRPTDAVALLGEAATGPTAWPPDLAARLHEEVLSLADVDLASRALALGYVGSPASRRGDEPDAFGCAHLAVARLMSGDDAAGTAALAARGLRDGVLLKATQTGSSLFFLLVFALTVAGDFATAETYANAALTQARTDGSAIAFALASWARGMVALRRGSLTEAEAELQISLDVIALNRVPTMAHLVFVHFIDLMLERGEPERVPPAASRVGLDLDRLDNGTQGTILQLMRGRLRIAQGQAEAGIADTREAAELFGSWGAVNPGLYHWHTDTVLALRASGETERARELAEEQLRLAHAWGAPRTVADALRASALVEQADAQVELLRSAREALDGSGAELMRARVLTDLGAALRRANARAAAREPLSEALELAIACGSTQLAERARTELWATGARPSTPLRTGIDTLTPSERRIAGLAAAGQTNAEIAQDLFITVKTVEMHLTRAYRKLGVTSRRDLPADIGR